MSNRTAPIPTSATPEALLGDILVGAPVIEPRPGQSLAATVHGLGVSW